MKMINLLQSLISRDQKKRKQRPTTLNTHKKLTCWNDLIKFISNNCCFGTQM